MKCRGERGEEGGDSNIVSNGKSRSRAPRNKLRGGGGGNVELDLFAMLFCIVSTDAFGTLGSGFGGRRGTVVVRLRLGEGGEETSASSVNTAK